MRRPTAAPRGTPRVHADACSVCPRQSDEDHEHEAPGRPRLKTAGVEEPIWPGMDQPNTPSKRSLDRGPLNRVQRPRRTRSSACKTANSSRDLIPDLTLL